MKSMEKLVWLPLVLCLTVIHATPGRARTPSGDQREEQTILVAHISHVEGQLLRYDPDEEGWVVTVKDAPFGIDEVLLSGEDARAEFIMPNNTWMRIDADTQIQLIALQEDVTGIHVASGVARFYNKGSDVAIKVTTPFGYVTAPGETGFDLCLGDNSVEVSAFKGTVDFVHTMDDTRFEVIEGSSSVVANDRRVTSGEGYIDPAWERWNRDRDNLWRKRAKLKGESAKYIPPALHHEAYVLEKYGRWARVYYGGGYYYFWRPVYVGLGWAPFTVGRWTIWYGDHCWIPTEPFGYITHHYGNWIFVGGSWYWAPPVPRVRVHLGPPLLDMEFAWYPGRVAWIHSGAHIGWVPLAPREPYYCHYPWGRRAVVVKNLNTANINIRIDRYRHLNRAVIINIDSFYKTKNYKKLRIRHINSDTLINKYRVAPVVDRRVINNYKNNRKRYNFTNVHVTRKPDRELMNKTRKNQLPAKGSSYVKAKQNPQNVANTRRVKPLKGDRPQHPRPETRLALGNQTNKPPCEPKFIWREFDRKAKSREEDKGQDIKSLSNGPMKRLPQSVLTQEMQFKDQGRPDSRMRNAWKIWSSNTVPRQHVKTKIQGNAHSQIQKAWGKRLSSRR